MAAETGHDGKEAVRIVVIVNAHQASWREPRDKPAMD